MRLFHLSFHHLRAFIFSVFFIFATIVFAQTNKGGTTFVSNIDEGLTIKKLIVMPFKDNVNGIYANALTDRAVETHKDMHLWDVEKSATTIDPTVPTDVQKFLRGNSAQALLTAQIIKGPETVQINLSMYSAMDGKLLYFARQGDIRSFNLDSVTDAFNGVQSELLSQIPYRGLVLSRRGQEVTVNLGTKNGLRNSQTLTVLQIVKLHRHPKLGFMVGAEKVILGRVRIHKADEYLSFGEIEFEKEAGAIQINQKVMPDTFVNYGTDTGTGKAIDDLKNRPDEAATLGKDPKEWNPEDKPHVGLVRVQAGFVQYSQSVAMSSSGTQTINTNFGPTLDASGELWLNSMWFMDADIRQSIFTASNPLAGSNPGNIDMSLSYYTIAAGYNFIPSDRPFAQKLQGLLGISQFQANATQTTPIVATNMSYGGLYLGLRGFMDLGPESTWLLGAEFNYHLTRTIAEGISSGSSSTPNITEFQFLVKHMASERMNYVGGLGFSYYDSNFGGTTTRPETVYSISHKNTILTVGIEYLF